MSKAVLFMKWPDSVAAIFDRIREVGGIIDVDERGVSFDMSNPDATLFDLGVDWADTERAITSDWLEPFHFEVTEVHDI